MRSRSRLGRREFLVAAGSLAGGFSAVGVEAAAPGAAAGRDPEGRRRLLRDLEAAGARHWSVPRQDGELLHFLVKATRATRVLEIGTSHGYSAIWMGLALEETGGRLTTIEIDHTRHELARRHVGEAGLGQRITLIQGDAHAELPKLEGSFDFVFLDADKEGQVDYFNALVPRRLLPGGILAVHNAIHQAAAMGDYLGLVRQHRDFDTVVVSATMSDGFCLSYRRRA